MNETKIYRNKAAKNNVQKGNKPHNTKQIEGLRVNVDGHTLVARIFDDQTRFCCDPDSYANINALN